MVAPRLGLVTTLPLVVRCDGFYIETCFRKNKAIIENIKCTDIGEAFDGGNTCH